MIYYWVLVFYIDGSYAGGPAVAQFQNKEACLAADQILKKKWTSSYEGACVSTVYPDQRSGE